jgi:hypothetical protein
VRLEEIKGLIPPAPPGCCFCLSQVYGFEGEVKAKYSQFIYELFTALFCTQPLGTLINNKVRPSHR